MPYWTIPEEAFDDDPDIVAVWARADYEAARRMQR